MIANGWREFKPTWLQAVRPPRRQLPQVYRIAKRVEAGGRNFPEADVRRGYGWSLENLPVAAHRADHALRFDNSTGQATNFWFGPLPQLGR